MAEQPQGGTNSTQRTCSVTSSNKKGHTNSREMRKPLLQSSKLGCWASWDSMMIWLVIVRNVRKKTTSDRKCQSTESEMFCRMCRFEQAANKTQQFSASCLLGSPTQLLRSCWRTGSQLRSPGVLNFWAICLSELLPTFLAQETCLHKQRGKCIVSSLVAAVVRACKSGMGSWSPHPEWSMRNRVSVAQPGY